MAKALISLIDDPLLRDRLGAAGAELARENYSINNYVNRLDELYCQLIGIDKSTRGDNTTEEPWV